MYRPVPWAVFGRRQARPTGSADGKVNTGTGLDRGGGAILSAWFDKVVVSNCLLDSNMQSGEGWHPPQAGPAIYLYYSSAMVTNSTFANNWGPKAGAPTGAYCPTPVIAGNVFFGNGGDYGAIACAIYGG